LQQQYANFDRLNYSGRAIAFVPVDLLMLIESGNKSDIIAWAKSQNISADMLGGLFISYVEGYMNKLSPLIFNTIIDIEPRLVCVTVAYMLFCNGCTSALELLETRGYQIDSHFVYRFIDLAIKDMVGKSEEQLLQVGVRYGPLLRYLVNRGFTTEISTLRQYIHSLL
jgi:hypothetical protein